MKRFLLLTAFTLCPLASQQIYDLLIKGGHVIDPKNKRNQRLDIAIAAGRIAAVANSIPAAHARKVIQASDYYVTPGLIDINTHFGRNLNPDHNSLRNCVTTAVARDGKPVEKKGAERARTRLLYLPAGASSPAQLNTLQKGEIFTGTYSRNAPPIDQLRAARARGVLFDVGHGSDGFWFRVAVPAIKQGFLPDTISTGMDKDSILLPRATMTNVLSKFLAIGLSLDQVIERATVNAARAIAHPELGGIDEMTAADIAILDLRKGRFAFLDSGHAKLTADTELACVLTIRNGDVAWDAEGLSLTHWRDAGPYSNYK